MKAAERDEFNRVGISASNVYYINEDAKKARMATLKGTGRFVADDLRRKQENIVSTKQDQMRKEAEVRLAQIEQLRNEDILEKEKKRMK